MRAFHIHGEVMVRVKFGIDVVPFNSASGIYVPPIAGSTSKQVFELGLAVDNIRVEPVSYHTDVHVNDFGGKVPADVIWNLSEATIRMAVIHYDQGVLDSCMAQSFGGAVNVLDNPIGFTDTPEYLPGAGQPLGNGLPLLFSGCFYQSLNLLSPRENFPWRFPSAYLSERPVLYPMGTSITVAQLTWRAIPYPSDSFENKVPVILSGGSSTLTTGGGGGGTGLTNYISITTPKEITSSGAVLFDHFLDT